MLSLTRDALTMTQEARVLQALQLAGDRGITSVDFTAGRTYDGAEPIMRVAARVQELRKKGHEITSTGRRGRLAVYVLWNTAPC